jgi:hypothetical protein
MRMWSATGVALLLAIAIPACGGTGNPSPGGAEEQSKTATQPAASPTAPTGVRWIPGFAASDLRAAFEKRGLKCQAPREERATTSWVCEAVTPLITYHVEFYGAPAKIEYLRAVVSQGGRSAVDAPKSFLGFVAALKYEGAEPETAKSWAEANFAAGGDAMFGPVKYRLSGEPRRLVLEIKAPGSDW